MKDFNLRDLLEFKPEEGVISLKENRMVLLQATALGYLKHDLIYTLGQEIAQGILYRFGYRCGVHDAKMVITNYGEEIKNINLGPIIYRWKGNGQVKVIKELRFGPNLCRYHVEGRWENSYEAEHYIQHFGMSEYPICWISTGYASGFSSIITGQELICLEKTCAGMGHKYCSWEMRTRENWGSSAIKDLYDLNFKFNFKNLQTMIAEQKSIDFHKKMTLSVLEGEGIHGIIKILSEILRSHVIIFDRFLNVIALCWHGSNDNIQIDILRQDLQDYLASYKKPIHFSSITKLSCWMENYEQQTWIVSPIIAGTNSWGYLLVKEEKNFSNINLFIIEHASTLCALEHLKKDSALEVELRLKGDLLDELFSNDELSKEEILSRAMKLGCDLKMLHQVFVIDLFSSSVNYNQNNPAGDVFEFIKAGIGDLIKRHLPDSLIAVKKNRIVVLMTHHTEKEKIHNTTSLIKLTRQWVASNLPNYSVNIVWGRLCLEFEDYRKSFQEAWKAASILRDLGRQGENVGFEDLGIYALLWESGNKEQLKDYALSILGHLVDYDREHNTNFLWTLELFLDNKCSLSETAKSTFLHINTLRYRIKRIEELTGIDLSSNEGRFQAQLSIKLLKLIGIT